MIVYLEITDSGAFDAYRKVAGPTLAAYEGKPVVAGGAFEVLEGMIYPKSVVVIEFPSVEQAKKWYASPEYSQLIPQRQRAANSHVVLVEGLA
jgi:uncharacterized protein (DUF1330 family)